AQQAMKALAAAALLVALPLQAGEANAAEPLPRLGADRAQTSVSGLSSGAYMAGQIEVAHAQDIIGAGIVAGGPFACAESAASRIFPFWPTAVAQNAAQALYRCMRTDWGEPDPAELAKRARELAGEGANDPIEALKGDNVYLYSGQNDRTVALEVVKAAKRFYDDLGVPAGNLTLVEGDGGHAFITEEGGAACGLSEAPYVTNCGYDQAKAILAWIYGPLAPKPAEPEGNFIVFDQSEFAGYAAEMAGEGVVYVPKPCAEAPGCRVHIALHGCGQSREQAGDAFIKEAGFAEAADANRIVVLFPQVEPSAINPEGCWDWWGYTGLDFLGKDAPQIAAIWAMVERLTDRKED
ncbi:MAG TPA: poly(3-hydroxybutyrate) depolymerase, partial [Methyloceanibacter sp.]|nr:poly(3-hydroxybutyrate) depolymerase [Methyloceanibacter sp.]